MIDIIKPPVTRKLDLACGQSPRDWFEGVDIFPGAQHVVDLQRYPWPFEDDSVIELNCSHYIEHIPMEYVAQRDVPCRTCINREADDAYCEDCRGHRTERGPLKDALFAFFDECYRILVPDGWLHIVVPAHRSDRAFQDPTHRRFVTAQTFAYMNEDWRRVNRLDHYNVDCNFIGDCHPVVAAELNLRFPETAQRMIQRDWNTVIDWTAKMQKKSRLSPRSVP
jgi:predicted SAM-dependent methyltransferase